MNKYIRLLFFIALCEATGIIGSIFTINSIDSWYQTLNKPFFTPPGWVFGPAWTTLYLLMGISLYLVWGKKKINLKWFWTQLFLNFIWSIVFFGLQNLALSFIIIVLLWGSIFLTIKSFIKIKNAAYLLIPYIIWVSFALLLNFSILILNK
jgi:tryptophan-rich sensory protein